MYFHVQSHTHTQIHRHKCEHVHSVCCACESCVCVCVRVCVLMNNDRRLARWPPYTNHYSYHHRALRVFTEKLQNYSRVACYTHTHTRTHSSHKHTFTRSMCGVVVVVVVIFSRTYAHDRPPTHTHTCAQQTHAQQRGPVVLNSHLRAHVCEIVVLICVLRDDSAPFSYTHRDTQCTHRGPRREQQQQQQQQGLTRSGWGVWVVLVLRPTRECVPVCACVRQTKNVFVTFGVRYCFFCL